MRGEVGEADLAEEEDLFGMSLSNESHLLEDEMEDLVKIRLPSSAAVETAARTHSPSSASPDLGVSAGQSQSHSRCISTSPAAIIPSSHLIQSFSAPINLCCLSSTNTPLLARRRAAQTPRLRAQTQHLTLIPSPTSPSSATSLRSSRVGRSPNSMSSISYGTPSRSSRSASSTSDAVNNKFSRRRSASATFATRRAAATPAEEESELEAISPWIASSSPLLFRSELENHRYVSSRSIEKDASRNATDAGSTDWDDVVIPTVARRLASEMAAREAQHGGLITEWGTRGEPRTLVLVEPSESIAAATQEHELEVIPSNHLDAKLERDRRVEKKSRSDEEVHVKDVNKEGGCCKCAIM